jgi:hypothetical protein
MIKPKTTAEAIIAGTLNVTAKWAKQRKQEEKHSSARGNRSYVMMRVAADTVKSIAYEVMKDAYLKASSNGTLPAHARQIMYQARPLIQKRTDKQLSDQYFCQTLLPDYMKEKGVDWNVVYDDRGHFTEPHTEREVGLGTLNVRHYLKGMQKPLLLAPKVESACVATHGPAGAFGSVMFTEKEGFMPLFDASGLANRHDMAIMSSKGLSSTAARSLVDKLCGRLDVPLLVLHDFDKSGFSILGTLKRATRRFTFQHNHTIIDLGLRLTDVEELGLEAEDSFDRGDDDSKRANLKKNGATDDEIGFLIGGDYEGDRGQRVELNALASDQLIQWIEMKLDHHGIKKVIPDQKQLADVYRLLVRGKRIEEILQKELDKPQDKSDVTVPDNLEAQVKEYLKENSAVRWDYAVSAIAFPDDPKPQQQATTNAVADVSPSEKDWMGNIANGLRIQSTR